MSACAVVSAALPASKGATRMQIRTHAPTPSFPFFRRRGCSRSRDTQLQNDQYKLPGCPRDLNPVCGSDMVTYPNECTLCMEIREEGKDIKIIQDGPC
ncbi:PREDICTED: pancreatic secretory trypsin inhibitor-like [Elephantulus edwardii]|uniref:pancreatic secretory trypsin inhibitor-like n=1 Tax=Elephantulus edwardii TaxID=28737 RepID=UPI0003F0884D|nr:PREDICTED: pancreatic secretory trypsin inhibitor-like [Elephantulus edwardii]